MQTDRGSLLPSSRLREMLRQIDPRERMTVDVEDLLAEIAEELTVEAFSAACKLAKHRGSRSVDVRDVHLHLERERGIHVPGHAQEEDFARGRKRHRPTTGEPHGKRLDSIKRSIISEHIAWQRQSAKIQKTDAAA